MPRRSSSLLKLTLLPPRKVSRMVLEKKSQSIAPSGPALPWLLTLLGLSLLLGLLLLLRG